MQVFVPCMKSTSARAWDESKTARRHITIPRRSGMCARQGRAKGAENVIYSTPPALSVLPPRQWPLTTGCPPLATCRCGRVKSPQTRGCHQDRAAGYMQVVSTDTEITCLLCSSSRHGCRHRLLGPQVLSSTLVSLLLFRGGNRPRTSVLQHHPQPTPRRVPPWLGRLSFLFDFP